MKSLSILFCVINGQGRLADLGSDANKSMTSSGIWMFMNQFISNLVWD